MLGRAAVTVETDKLVIASPLRSRLRVRRQVISWHGQTGLVPAASEALDNLSVCQRWWALGSSGRERSHGRGEAREATPRAFGAITRVRIGVRLRARRARWLAAAAIDCERGYEHGVAQEEAEVLAILVTKRRRARDHVVCLEVVSHDGVRLLHE